MNNYYFTFGQVHTTRNGMSLKDKWVRVVAEDEQIARCIFITMFCVPYLKDVRKWSHQYDAKRFNPEYFPAGELACYRQLSIQEQAPELTIPNT